MNNAKINNCLRRLKTDSEYLQYIGYYITAKRFKETVEELSAEILSQSETDKQSTYSKAKTHWQEAAEAIYPGISNINSIWTESHSEICKAIHALRAYVDRPVHDNDVSCTAQRDRLADAGWIIRAADFNIITADGKLVARAFGFLKAEPPPETEVSGP